MPKRSTQPESTAPQAAAEGEVRSASLSRSPAVERAPVDKQLQSIEGHVDAILKDNAPLISSMAEAVRSAYDEEPHEHAKPIRALDTLVNTTFRIATQGPDFLLPAMAAFLKVGEMCSDCVKVQLPTVDEGLVNQGIREAREEQIPDHALFRERLASIIRGGDSRAHQGRSSSDGHFEDITVSFGIPHIRMGELARLPSSKSPLEVAILTAAFLTLMEETIHAGQDQRLIVEVERLDNPANTASPDAVLCSQLARDFFHETKKNIAREIRSADGLSDRTQEIDVVGRLVELAQEHKLPIECLKSELSVYHAGMREPFVRWLKERGVVPNHSFEDDHYLKERGRSEPVPYSQHVPPQSLPTQAQELLTALGKCSESRNRVQAIGQLLGEPGTYAALTERSTTILARDMKRVFSNLEKAADARVITSRSVELAKSSFKDRKAPLPAVVLEEYLARIGFLVEA